MQPQTVYAAYQVSSTHHITIFYRNNCDEYHLNLLKEHIQSLPIGRMFVVNELKQLDNPNDANDPLWGVTLQVLTEDQDVDFDLMEKISTFSDMYSYRDNLTTQYKFTMHITLGPASIFSNNEKDIMCYATELVKDFRLFNIYYKLKTDNITVSSAASSLINFANAK